ncbi:MAG: efflux RND transporter permease subunit, partial [Candidatus Latescibacteria bacterium]|nr:efflux RND transporter permease subunit [Candidatus Latescibacterota bacterium]
MTTNHPPPQTIFGVTISRPVAILMTVITISVFGYVSYRQLPLNLMPDISYPTLTVRTEYPAAAPEEVESLISRPIEQQLGIISHLVRISSVSKPGFSDVILEFTWDTDMNIATQDVREKLDQVTLPEEVKRPMILRYDPSLDPITRIGLYGGADLVTLRRVADTEIRRDLEAVSGVAAVKVKGGLEEEIGVAIDEGRIALLDLSMGEINRRLMEENINVAGGSLKDGQTEYLVRTLNEFRDVDEIARIVVGRRNGSDIRVADIAKVWKTHKERETITRVNGVESVEIDIHKEGDANIVAVAERIRNRLFGTAEQRAFVERLTRGMDKDGKGQEDPAKKAQQLRQMTDFLAYRLPESMHLDLLSDQSTFIRQSIDEVKSTAIIGGLLAVGILYLFLRNLLHTLVIGIVIPVSVLATFASMQIFGVSLNIMSLGGLALGIGMLVDNSIVVLESIFRCREEGDPLRQAVIRGTSEVGGAVFSSTLTTVAVFFPIVFVEGVAGQIFGDMAMTVVFSLLASLGAALFFTPMLAAREWRGRGGIGRRSAVLTFGIVETITARWQSGAAGRVTGILRLMPGLLLDLFGNIILTVIAVLPVLLKGVIGIIGILLLPLITVIGRLTARGIWQSFFEKFTEWMMDDTLWGRIIFQRVWKGLLELTAPRDFRTGVFRVGQWLVGGRGWRRWGRVVLIPLIGLYIVLRFFFQMLIELLGKVVTILIVFTILLMVLLLGLAGVVLFPITVLLLAGFERVFGTIRAVYPSTIRWGVNHRLTVLVPAGILLAVCWFVLLPGLGRELIPEVHQGVFTVEVATSVGTPIETTDRTMRQIETTLMGHPDIQRVASIAGVEKSTTTSSDEGEHTGKIIVTLNGGGNLVALEDRVIDRLRRELMGIPETTINISRPVLFSFKTPVEVEIRGYSLDQLQRISSHVEERMKGIENLYDVKATIQQGHPEVRITYDRNLLTSYGLNIHDVASLVQSKVEGNVPTRFKGYPDREIDILVRVEETYREGV